MARPRAATRGSASSGRRPSRRREPRSGSSRRSRANPGLDLDYKIVFDHPAIGEQSRTRSASDARDRCRRDRAGPDLRLPQGRRRAAPPGTGPGRVLANTVVLDDSGVVNGPLRFPDEFVRHKLLDLAGDLALLGRPLAGRVTARKAGHRLHLKAVRGLLGRLRTRSQFPADGSGPFTSPAGNRVR